MELRKLERCGGPYNSQSLLFPLMIPLSVMIAVIKLAGVISNAGEKTFTFLGAVRLPQKLVTSSDDLSSILILSPLSIEWSKLELGAAR